MRFMVLYKPGKEDFAFPPPAEMGKLIDEMTRAGVFLETDGLRPSSEGARLRISGRTCTVTDGPFAETKELIAGYAVLRVTSKAEAIDWAKRFLTLMGEGESEVRRMFDREDLELANRQ